MKYACYLCASEDAGRFDALFAQMEILSVVYDVETVKSLTAFVQREKTLIEKDFLIIDLSRGTYSNNHILNAVQHLRMYAKAELIFIAEPSRDTTQLFGNLASKFHVRNTIEKSANEADVVNQVRACILGETSPMKFVQNMVVNEAEEVKEAARPVPLEVQPGKSIDISVAGAMNRCGTTTQAFAIYRMLESHGLRPAILDNSGVLTAQLWDFCADAEGSAKHTGCTSICGVNFCTEISDNFNVYVQDLGVLTEWNAHHFTGADISVLVAPTKAWELPVSLPKIKFAQESRQNKALVIAATSTPEAEALEIEKMTGKLFRTPYRPDIWSESVEAEYSEHLLPLLRAVSGASRDIFQAHDDSELMPNGA